MALLVYVGVDHGFRQKANQVDYHRRILEWFGHYLTGDPGARTSEAQRGSLSIRLGLGWAKSQSLTTSQCPVMRYHRGLMEAIQRQQGGDR